MAQASARALARALARASARVWAQASARVSAQASAQASVPGQVPGQVPEQVPGRVPEQVPEQGPGRVPERVPEQGPERVPEQVPVAATQACVRFRRRLRLRLGAWEHNSTNAKWNCHFAAWRRNWGRTRCWYSTRHRRLYNNRSLPRHRPAYYRNKGKKLCQTLSPDRNGHTDDDPECGRHNWGRTARRCQLCADKKDKS